MEDRDYPYAAPGREYGRAYGLDRDYAAQRDYGSGRDYTYSSARDYAAAGEDFERAPRRGLGRDYRFRGSGGDYRGSYWSDGHRTTEYGPAWEGREPRGWRDRGFLDRAGDEVRSWFGDDEAERRRAMDRRYDERRAAIEDDHYRAWRRSRIAELDRDYEEYRRENAERFEKEFNSWRTERQGQRQGLARVAEHMEVVGSDGAHVGTVDHVRGDRILLTRSDRDAGGHHHSIPSRWIDSVDDKVTIRKTADEAKAHWRDEERSGAFFGSGAEEREDERGPHILNRSFSGTY